MEATMFKIIVLILTAGLGVCFAQADQAAITGTISDLTQAAITSAHVSLVYPQPGTAA
jgi:hypothetical protein